jgi:hypothetical protein
MALPQDAVMEIMRIAREAARDHYQGEQRVFEQRYQNDMSGATREIRELQPHQQMMTQDYRLPIFDLVRICKTIQEHN